jgi:hypothetical protein
VTKLLVRKYEPADFLRIELSEGAKIGREGQPAEEWALDHYRCGPAFTVVDPEERIVFCGGLHIMWKGTAILWSVFSLLAGKYPNTLRVARCLLDYYQNERGFTRIQCDVDPGWSVAVRFVECLGFQCEGLMRCYGPNGYDRLLYARVKDLPQRTTILALVPEIDG